MAGEPAPRDHDWQRSWPAAASLTATSVIATLNEILELELAGVVRYMHYSF